MRLKVPFLRFALAGLGFLLPTAILAAILPFLVNAQPIRAKLLREISSWTGAEVKVAGAISVRDFFALSVEARDVEIGQLMQIAPVEGMTAKRIVARIAWSDLLMGNFEFDKIKIFGAVFKLRSDSLDDIRTLYADLISGPGMKPFAALYVEDSIVAIRAGAGQPYRRLAIQSALAQSARSERQLVTSAHMTWQGDLVRVAARSGFRVSPDTRVPLRAEITSRRISGEFDGEAKLAGVPEMLGELTLRTASLAKLADWLGVGAATGVPDAPVGMSGHFALSGDTVALTSGEVSFAGQTAQAALTLERGGALPHLEGTLAFNHLDLKAMLGRAGMNSVLKGYPLEADLRVSANAMGWDTLAAGETALTLTSRAGTLTAEVAELDLLGGEVRGNIAVEEAGQSMHASARLSADGLDAAALLRLARQRDWLSGAADLNLEAEATWDDPADIADRVVARARVNFPDGGQMRLDIPRLASATPGENSGWGTFEFTNAAFDKLRFDMTLRQGQISFAEVLLASAGRDVKGNGEIDLEARSLDWRFTFAPDAAAPRGGASRGGDGRSVTSRLSIKGPWARPVIRSGDGPNNSMLAPPERAAALELSFPGR